MIRTRYEFVGAAVRLANGGVLAPGAARSAEPLDLASFTFRPVAGELPEAYHFATATRLADDDVAITGGHDSGNQNTAGVWVFHGRAFAYPGGDRWRCRSPGCTLVR